ncbi:T6SS immunity protein Tli4 family protein, partial [Citrobacter sp. Cb223]
VSKDVSQMQSLMARISGRDNDVIPVKPGSCITHAFIATDTTAADREDISVGLESKILEHIRIILSTDNYTR